MSNHQDQDIYDEDDPLVPRSPPLKPVEIKLAPDYPASSFASQQGNKPVVRKGKQLKRRKVRPSQGDVVLLNFLDPNRPDLAQAAGNHVLQFSSSSDGGESQDSDTDMEDLDSKMAAKIEQQERERAMAKEAYAKTALHVLLQKDGMVSKSPPRKGSDGWSGFDGRSKSDATEGLKINGINGVTTLRRPIGTGQKHSDSNVIALNGQGHSSTDESRASMGGGVFPGSDSLVTSPISTHLRNPPSPNDRLPAIHDPGSRKSRSNPSSPQSNQLLPSAKILVEVANKINAETTLRHRQQSFSSASGPSPTFHPYANVPSPFPLNHGSPPTSLDSATSPRDFSRSIIPSPQYVFPRRPSQASETFSALHSATTTTTESFSSPDSFSPGTHTSGTATTTPSEHGSRLSIEIGRAPILPPPSSHVLTPYTAPSPGPLTSSSAVSNITLPPPVPSGSPQTQSQQAAQAQMQGQSMTGSYKCTHAGCTAMPFQTQYLLNSHATVHSQSRPHYCPVAGCPRAVDGRGFKRKNEMIRHGLVHESPGYVCPFCPDREHKYPRPDNLQRHVRVHHGDVDRGDQRLREVLERRSSGAGNRGGRRRRVT